VDWAALKFAGADGGKSNVIGAWSEIRSFTGSFNARMVWGKCGADKSNCFLERGSLRSIKNTGADQINFAEYFDPP
jgi:hypothetical protein